MKNLFYLPFFIILIYSCKKNTSQTETSMNKPAEISQQTTTYYFIRHGEKDRSQSTSNPDLLPKGQKRAEFWAEVLADKNIELIYSTNYKRTIQTATPTAEKFGLEIKKYEANNLFSEEFQEETKGKNVLIVGHVDTTPKFINKILGKEKYKFIPDNENNRLYTVKILPSEKKKSSFKHYHLK